jgi:molybdopterin/thiamine biosynthesis adenylyltransferase
MRTIVMVGAGGTASHLIHPLIAYLSSGEDFIIHLYDADKVEPRNLSRQLFYANEVGQHKSRALAMRFDPHVAAHTEFIGPDNIEKSIIENDTVLICADNMFVRRLINDRAKTLDNILVINGGNEKFSASVQVFARQNGTNTTPSLDFFSPEFDIDDGPDRSTLSCAQLAELPGGEQTVVANNTAAAFMLQALARADEDVYTQEMQWTKATCDIMAGTVQTSDVRLIGGLDSGH